MVSSTVRQHKLLNFFVILALVLAVLPLNVQTVQAVSTDVVIYGIYGGGGNTGAPYKNDFVVLFNRGTTTVSLSGKTIQYASATGTGNFSSNPITALSGNLAPGQYYLVQQAGGTNGVALPTPNATGTVNMSASGGKVALVNSTTGIACNGGSTPCSSAQLAQIIDLVGWDGANFYETAPAPATTNTTAVNRKFSGCLETDNNSADFVADVPDPRNTATTPYTCPPDLYAPTITNTIPTRDATNVSLTSNLDITFNEPVNVSGNWFQIVCGTSGTRNPADTGVTGGPTTFTINPNTDFVNSETCTVTVYAANVTDQDTNDPLDNMAADHSWSFTTLGICSMPYTTIPQVQGSGPTAAITGIVTVQGVVIGDNEGSSPALRGFYLQDPTGDGNEATSDGIFVFNGNNNSVSLGDLARVTGTAYEFNDQTQIGTVTSIINCGTGSVSPVNVTLPFPTADYLERYEGMLVKLPQTLFVTEHFQLGRFDMVVVSSGDRLDQPTNVVAPGAPALAMQAANNLNRIIIDDSLNNQNPDPILFGRGGATLTAANTLRGGDTIADLVGVMTYTWAGNSASGNAYRVRPINALGGSVPNFVAANPRPATPPDVGGTLKVVGMNLLNFFNTFDGLPDTVDNCTMGVGGAATDCRGADKADEFARQLPKTVAAIVGMDADVVAFNEIENDGYGPTSAIQFLVDQLNAATASGTYALIDADARTGQINALGTDAIKVGMIYKPAKVTPIGLTAVLNSVAFVNGGDGSPRSRPSLAQAFEQNSNKARFIVNINHLKSKGSACDAPDAGDGQGNCNVVRSNSATVLAAWLASDPTGIGDPDILLVGDYNSYAKEDPITILKGAGYTDLINEFIGSDAYSYVFDGQWGYLDHALGSNAIEGQVTGVVEWHINADEPSVLDYNTDFKTANLQNILYAPDQFRISDHDPVMVGLKLNGPPTVSAGGPYSVNEGSTVTLTATGTDPDGDSLTYAWDLNNDGVFETSGQSVTYSWGDGPNTFVVKVRATDPGGLSATAQGQVTVLNVAPTVSAPTFSPEPSVEGAAVTASAAFSDPASAADAPYTCTVDYGDGSPVQTGVVSGYTCTGPAHVYTTYGQYSVVVQVTDKDGGAGSNHSTHTVWYNFTGFFMPIEMPPAVNTVNAGSVVPIKFNLGGNKGLNIFLPDFPLSTQIACDTGAPMNDADEVQNPGGSGLTFDPSNSMYQYNWKTLKTWSGTCRALNLGLNDGSSHWAIFQFR